MPQALSAWVPSSTALYDMVRLRTSQSLLSELSGGTKRLCAVFGLPEEMLASYGGWPVEREQGTVQWSKATGDSVQRHALAFCESMGKRFQPCSCQVP